MRARGAAWSMLLTLGACAGAQTAPTTEAGTDADPNPQVITISASRWSFEPSTISLQKGVPVTLELSSSDVHHGFNVPGLGIRTDILPDHITELHVTPKTAGTFLFHCDYYCGSGHEGMAGQIVVE